MEKKKMNKKGAEMTIGTIIIIILALVVLVVLIYGFTVGWGNLWDNLMNIGGGKVNVQTIVQGCEISCTTGATFDYCSKTRNVIFDNNKSNPKNKKPYTCRDLEFENVGLTTCENVNCESTVSFSRCTEFNRGRIVTIGGCNTPNSIEQQYDALAAKGLACCIPQRTCSDWNGEWIDPSKNEVCKEGYGDWTSFVLGTDRNLAAHQGKKCCIKN